MGEVSTAGLGARELPTGTVTFLFTDLEGSTRLLQAHPRAYRDAVRRHHALLRGAVEGHGGAVFETVGDAVYAAFASPAEAVAAALVGQLALGQADWGALGRGALRARMALHTGEAERHGAHYFGAPLYRAGRLTAGRPRRPGGALGRHDGARAGRPAGRGGPPRLGGAPPEGPAAARARLPARPPGPPRRVPRPAHPGRAPAQPAPAADQLRGPGAGAGGGGGPAGRPPPADPHRPRGDGQDPPGAAGRGRRPGGRTRTGCGWRSWRPWPTRPWCPRRWPQAVGVREEPGRPLLATLTDALRPKRLLLLLDNCEHLLDACARLADALLRACPHLRLLCHQPGGAGHRRGGDLAGALAGAAGRAGGHAGRARRRSAWRSTRPCGSSSTGPWRCGRASGSPTRTRPRWPRSATGWTASPWPWSWRRRGCGSCRSSSSWRAWRTASAC